MKIKIGDTFHRLTVTAIVDYNRVLASCKCGSIRTYYIGNLRNGSTKSCGCYRKERVTLHGLTDHSLFVIWKDMRRRCCSPNRKGYERYGGRGIKVCDEWNNAFLPFYNWAIKNRWAKGLYIDRIDNNGNYEPDNCRFVTNKVNCRNTQRNRLVTFKGETKCLSEWCELFNLSYGTTLARIDRLKWPADKAFTASRYAKLKSFH